MSLAELASPEWLARYQAIIRDGAADADLSAIEFGMFEVLKNVPERLRHGRGPDVLFGFRISGGKLEFPEEPWPRATFTLTAEFESIAPFADLSAEKTRAAGIMERLVRAGKMSFAGDLAAAPDFFHRMNLHDRLAEITAPYVAKPSWQA